MPCYSPHHCFNGGFSDSGKVSVLWKAPKGTERLELPCGKCVGCRLAYAKQWAIRCMHEAQMHKDNCFVTLTYNDDNLPKDGNLHVEHFQLFMKRLRKKFARKRIRFFHAGEYGSDYGRPHFHALLFGIDFDDKVLSTIRNGNRVYVSKTLDILWPEGYHSIGDVTYASAGYVARYCLKKVDGFLEFYRDEETGIRYQMDKRNGEIKIAEYTTMSRMPGIGTEWFNKYHSDVYPSDEVVYNGRRNKPPRFYDNLLDKKDSDMFESVKSRRNIGIDRMDNDSFRLPVKEEVKVAQIKSLRRSL